MKYYAKIEVEQKELDYINQLLVTEPKCEKDCMGEDETITYTARFSNGYEMDIKVCGVQYEEGGYNTPWTEAVLFNERGVELCFSEVSEDIEGDWCLCDNDDNEYCATVLPKKEVKTQEVAHEQ